MFAVLEQIRAHSQNRDRKIMFAPVHVVPAVPVVFAVLSPLVLSIEVKKIETRYEIAVCDFEYGCTIAKKSRRLNNMQYNPVEGKRIVKCAIKEAGTKFCYDMVAIRAEIANIANELYKRIAFEKKEMQIPLPGDLLSLIYGYTGRTNATDYAGEFLALSGIERSCDLELDDPVLIATLV